jgi:hypothetical protein
MRCFAFDRTVRRHERARCLAHAGVIGLVAKRLRLHLFSLPVLIEAACFAQQNTGLRGVWCNKSLHLCTHFVPTVRRTLTECASATFAFPKERNSRKDQPIHAIKPCRLEVENEAEHLVRAGCRRWLYETKPRNVLPRFR